MARPVEWTEEKKAAAQDLLCTLIATSTKGLRTICEEEPDLPSYSLIKNWLRDDAEFVARYARAREDQAHLLAAQVVEIADEKIDTKEADASRISLEQRRQRIDARKWAAAKLNPKAYGDKLELGGGLTVSVPDDQLESRLALLLGKAGIALPARGEGTPEGEAEAVRALPGFRASEA